MIVFLHNDLDAVGCQMCIEEMPFKVTKTFYTNYTDFDDKVKEIILYAKQNQETELVIADLSFAERPDKLIDLVNTFESILHVDHHSYPPHFFDRIRGKGKYRNKIDTTRCACKLCYELFHLEDKTLKVLVDVIDVFDCWRTESKMFDKAQRLNDYLWERGWDAFKEFKNGVPQDYQETMEKVQKRTQETISKMKKAGYIIRSEKNLNKITFVLSFDCFNAIMIEEMNQGQKFVVAFQNGLVRFRIKKDALPPEVLKDFREAICGKVTGHELAFTYQLKNDIPTEISKIVEVIELFKPF